MDFFTLENAVRKYCNIPDHHALYLSYDSDRQEVCFYHSDGFGKLNFGSANMEFLGLLNRGAD